MDNMDTQGQSATTYDSEPLVSNLELIGLWLKRATFSLIAVCTILTGFLLR